MSINIFSDLLKEPNPENLAWKVVEFIVPLYQKNGFTVALEILSIACMLLGALMLTCRYAVTRGTFPLFFHIWKKGEVYDQGST